MLERFAKFSFALNQLYRYWHQLTSDEMYAYDLRGPHSVYLLAIYNHPEGLSATQLCEICGRDKADVSRTMACLENKGIVAKEGDLQNHYRGVYKLTDLGMDAAEHVCRRASLAVDLAGRDLTPEDRAAFYRALESITGNLHKLSKEGLPKT